ncbi:MAG: hypothetical protein JWM81_1139 [Candidatus Saccharibacteria bacterium]|nr:hypothetical protein [Candidatus Saccharibacteria bacterium]
MNRKRLSTGEIDTTQSTISRWNRLRAVLSGEHSLGEIALTEAPDLDVISHVQPVTIDGDHTPQPLETPQGSEDTPENI